MPNVFRNLPTVTELLESPPLKALLDRANRNAVVTRVKQILDDMQSQVRAAATGMHVPAPAELAMRIADWLNADRGPAILPVINATGVILHPKLGGAPLADEAIAELAALTHGYASFSTNLATGGEASQIVGIQRQLQRLTNAEAASVTNSLASAAIACLAATATNREIIVCRGEVTSIEGNSRLPDLFQLSGARLREVGTADLTKIEDYANAISPETAAIMCVNASGLSVIGATTRPPFAELVAVARRSGLPIIQCLTQATLLGLDGYGVSGVPTVADIVQGGADLTIFPGGRFVGGPPCGIIVGRRAFVEKIENHSLMPAVQAEKLTLAALGATLRLYEEKEVAERAIPVLALLATPLENLRQRAERLAPQIAATGLVSVEVVPGTSLIAGNENPRQSLPTIVLALSPQHRSAIDLATALRTGSPPVMARIDGERLILDLRSVIPRDDLSLVNAFHSLANLPNAESTVSTATS